MCEFNEALDMVGVEVRQFLVNNWLPLLFEIGLLVVVNAASQEVANPLAERLVVLLGLLF